MNKVLRGKRVLVVEDEMMIMLSIEDVLCDLGCETLEVAATVDQALALIDAHLFDVAMLDVNLNGETSYPIADVLAARGVPFLFSTGYGQRGVDKRHGDRPVLAKPYRTAQLETLLAMLVTAGDPVAAVPASAIHTS